jgi:hypothetical protein
MAISQKETVNMMIWNDLQARVEEVKQEDGETIRHFEGSSHLVLSNGAHLRDLRDGRYIEEDGTMWTEAYEINEDEEAVHVGFFFRL